VVGLVDLGTTEANGIAFAVSAEVADPLLEAWQASPQPIDLSSACSEPESYAAPEEPPEEQEPAPGNDPAVTTFNGDYFSIAYPSEWDVETAEVSKGGYLDTTIRDPNDESIMLRVDVIPESHADPLVNARRVRSSLSRQPGYRELDFSATELKGSEAIRWEFLVQEEGVLMHKVDVFLATESGDEFAVLTQAPESEFARWADVFEAIRSSLSVYR
jgi:hypothetical protein